MKLRLRDCERPGRDTAERWCFSWQTPVQPLSCCTPPLSSRLIKNFTMASHNFHNHLQKKIISTLCVCVCVCVCVCACLFFLHLLLHYSFLSLRSSARVLWPSLELNELSLIIRGISGVEFGGGVCCILQALPPLLKWASPACKMCCVHIVFFRVSTLCYQGDVMGCSTSFP